MIAPTSLSRQIMFGQMAKSSAVSLLTDTPSLTVNCRMSVVTTFRFRFVHLTAERCFSPHTLLCACAQACFLHKPSSSRDRGCPFYAPNKLFHLSGLELPHLFQVLEQWFSKWGPRTVAPTLLGGGLVRNVFPESAALAVGPRDLPKQALRIILKIQAKFGEPLKWHSLRSLLVPIFYESIIL